MASPETQRLNVANLPFVARTDASRFTSPAAMTNMLEHADILTSIRQRGAV